MALSVDLINQSSQSMPRAFILSWLKQCERILLSDKSTGLKRLARRLSQSHLVVVFLDTREARRLNQRFRGRDYATDVLSFSQDTKGELGELILCPQVLKRQATDQGHSFRHELGLMLLHGVLHLLGLDHERGGPQARRMFAVQKRVYDRLVEKVLN